MDEKKTVFDYLAQVMIIFGFSMLILSVFCLIFGNTAKDISTLFALGDQGIPVGIALQFLCVSVLITGARFVFFTDMIIRKMPIWLRTVCMLSFVVMIIAAFIRIFNWFPVNMWRPWAMFFVCFGLSFLGSCFVVMVKEKVENRHMEEALRRLKEKEGNEK